MVIIPIDTFRKYNLVNADIAPAFLLNKKGAIRLNASAQSLCKLFDSELFLHFYNDDDHRLYIKLDKDNKHGLRMRYVADKKLCVSQSLAVVKYLVEKYNLSLPDKGSMPLDIVEADFGKFEIIVNQVKE